MVNLTGSYEFDAPREVVWEALQDPDVLSKVLPGCERLEQTGENAYEGEINIRVGPVQGSFKGSVTLNDIDPPNSYRMELSGQGRPGFVQGSGALRLEGDEPTTLHYDGEAQLSGRIASVGQRLIDSTARSLTRQGLQSLEKMIAARQQPQPEPAPAEPEDGQAPSSNGTANGTAQSPRPQASIPPPEPTTPSTVEVGVNVAKDVAGDLAQDIQKNLSQKEFGGRELLILLVGVTAVLWAWGWLFDDD